MSAKPKMAQGERPLERVEVFRELLRNLDALSARLGMIESYGSGTGASLIPG